MSSLRRTLPFLAVVLSLATTGCHHIASNYPEYLAKHAGQSRLPRVDAEASYGMTQRTERHRYKFRAATAGIANAWIVELGVILEQTLQSADLQSTFARLDRRTGAALEHGYQLTFDVVDFSVSGFSAHLTLSMTVEQNGATLLRQTYHSDGDQQASKVVWGGASTMRSATQHSTKTAIDAVMRQFLTDLNHVIGSRQAQARR